MGAGRPYSKRKRNCGEVLERHRQAANSKEKDDTEGIRDSEFLTFWMVE
jgi:hypothetical protein